MSQVNRASTPPSAPHDAGVSDAVAHAASLIEQADALIVAAGAGMGVDSGLPDFRGREGFWRAYPALKEAQLDFYNIAAPDAFARTPKLAWGFYGHRLNLYRDTLPHAGFGLLRRMADHLVHGLGVFTSNVDGQFQRAGFNPSQICECHGSIHHLQCQARCREEVWPADAFAPDVDAARCWLRNAPPTCPHCGEGARPNVLMFGDWAWVEQRTADQTRRLEQWLSQLSRPVVIELGAGTAIPSVRHFSQRVIHGFGGRLIRVNPTDWSVPTRLDVGIPLGALAALTAISAALGIEERPTD